MEKVTVNGKYDMGRNIWFMWEKRKVILTFSSMRRRRRGGSNNGKIQWKIPRIQQKSAYNWSLMENVLTGGFNTFDRSDQREKKTRENGCDQKLQISCTNSIKAKIQWLSERFSNHNCLGWSSNSISIIFLMYMYNTTKCPQGFHRFKAKNLWDDWNSAFQHIFKLILIQSTWFLTSYIKFLFWYRISVIEIFLM